MALWFCASMVLWPRPAPVLARTWFHDSESLFLAFMAHWPYGSVLLWFYGTCHTRQLPYKAMAIQGTCHIRHLPYEAILVFYVFFAHRPCPLVRNSNRIPTKFQPNLNQISTEFQPNFNRISTKFQPNSVALFCPLKSFLPTDPAPR